VALVVSIPWAFSAMRNEETFSIARVLEKGIATEEMITEIPEKYNEHPRRLLKDYQNQDISLFKVIQILILYQDRGEFRSLYETDTELDKYWIDKQEHKEIANWKEKSFNRDN